MRFIIVSATALAFFGCSQKTLVAPATPETRQAPSPEVASGTAIPSENIAKGKELYVNNCGKCHKLFAAESQAAEDWEPILKRMQKKARLDDPSMALIHDYIFSELPR